MVITTPLKFLKSFKISCGDLFVSFFALTLKLNFGGSSSDIFSILASLKLIKLPKALMWDMTELTKKLKEKNFKRHLETSGAYDISGDWDWICLSPKKQQLPKKYLYQMANELKIIVYNNHDLIFALEESKKVSDNCKLFLQPEWGKFEKINGKVVDFVKNNPRWILSLQTHKFLGID